MGRYRRRPPTVIDRGAFYSYVCQTALASSSTNEGPYDWQADLREALFEAVPVSG